MLDGPSALTLFRDRDYAANLEEDTTYESTEIDEAYQYCSDEDMLIQMAELDVLGHLTTTDDPLRPIRTNAALRKFARTRVSSVAKADAHSSAIKLVDLEALGVRIPDPTSPLFILVPDANAKRRVHNVRQRACNYPIPPNSFRRLGKTVFVPCVEFTFLLLARHLDLIELVMAGMEMCGYYRMARAPSHLLFSSSDVVYNCNPLTTPSELSEFIDAAKGFPGAAKAKRACRYLEAGSASPMETKIYLLMCLPRKLGGYGLPHPRLNVKHPVNAHAANVTHSQTLVPDLYWPDASIDIEYDSEEFHANPESLAKAARRTFALREMHVDVIATTSDIVHDPKAFDAVARHVARRLGVRLPAVRDVTANTKRAKLRTAVLYGA